MRVLGIETSCDETSAAVLDADGRILSNVVSSQMAMHARYGGVVPEIASRHHLENLPAVLDESLSASGTALDAVDLVAVTAGPGLVGALLVGLSAAKAIAFARGIPLVAVSHLEGHLYSPFLSSRGDPAREIVHPFHGLVVSGGHAELVRVEEQAIVPIARAGDDAPGEVFDKVARRAGLGYPGGPIVDRIAARANARRFPFKVGRFNDGSLDFTFSGLKSQLVRELEARGIAGERSESDVSGDLADLLAGFQRSIVDQLVDRLEAVRRREEMERVALSGGVAANSEIRATIAGWGGERGIEVFLPDRALTGDNAAMIAFAGLRRHRREGPRPFLEENARSRWPLGT
ncbi:MAG TPA: tRNA (adenosine(37)-N6)-threonylcarbamoyltransferase complex transferase subunit TsaD [Thermoanaerobaculia bacterium]|nr:tRNA (adenosine(37)-N6)-threonylcarbamoyltransferase complex transferase subunit TsaD [Thermoanaerobaculia bacterium]